MCAAVEGGGANEHLFVSPSLGNTNLFAASKLHLNLAARGYFFLSVKNRNL